MNEEVSSSPSPAGFGDSSDDVQAYLQVIGTVPLLTAAQEFRLAKLVVSGAEASLRLAAIADDDAVSPEIAERLAETIAKGADAKRKLVEANLRLVVSIAKRYRHRGLAFLDLIQEGNAGLVKAVERFDPDRGFKLSTYATWWIRQAMSRAVADQGRTIRIPVHVYEVLSRVLRTQRQMVQEHGREPSIEELAERVQIDVGRVRELLRLDSSTISIEPMGEGPGIADVLADDVFNRPDCVADRNALSIRLRQAIEALGEREQELMNLRFGLRDGQPRSLEEVGKVFGVTRERVRQIEVRALHKLRTPMGRDDMAEFLSEG